MDRTPKSKAGVPVFDLAKRTYTKWLTESEVEFMWFLLDSRARFNPIEPKGERIRRHGYRRGDIR